MVDKEMEVWRTAFKTVTYPVEYPGGVATNLDELMSAFEKWSGITNDEEERLCLQMG